MNRDNAHITLEPGPAPEAKPGAGMDSGVHDAHIGGKGGSHLSQAMACLRSVAGDDGVRPVEKGSVSG